jgi:hypothetical protein
MAKRHKRPISVGAGVALVILAAMSLCHLTMGGLVPQSLSYVRSGFYIVLFTVWGVSVGRCVI